MTTIGCPNLGKTQASICLQNNRNGTWNFRPTARFISSAPISCRMTIQPKLPAVRWPIRWEAEYKTVSGFL
jgi:hypothetical protein